MPVTAAETRRQVLAAAALVLLVAAVYAPTLWNGWVWDDDHYIAHTRHDRDLPALYDIWFSPRANPQYYPLVHTAFWVEYHLFGLHPAAYHAVNALLHAAGVVLLWRILRRLGVRGAWCAAAVFAVHPLAVETVAWATERKNTQSLALAAGAMLAMLRHYRIGAPEGARSRRGAMLALGVALFVLALWSKTVVAPLPCVLLLVLWWKRRPLNLRTLWPLGLMLALAVPLGLTTSWLERHHVGAVGQDWDFTLVERALIAGRAVAFYAGKVVWPGELIFIYPRWSIDAGRWTQWLYPLAVAAVLISAAALAWRGRLPRGVAVGLFVFVGLLAPASGFFDVYPMRFSFVADHFAYHAMTALIATLVGGAAYLLRGRPRSVAIAAAVLAAVVIAGFAAQTALRTRDYRDAETLWADTLAKNPQAIIAHFNLAAFRHADGRSDEAEALLQRAAEARPEHALPWEGLVWLYRELGRLEDAEAAARERLARLNEQTPRRGEALGELAWLLAQGGAHAEAAMLYEQAVALKPEDDALWEGLAAQHHVTGHDAAAAAAIARWAATRPGSARAQFELGLLRQASGDPQAAAAAYTRAIAADPAHARAHNNLAILHIQAGRVDAAIAHWRLATQADPALVDAWANLASALAQTGRVPEAVATLRGAIADAEARGDLGAIETLLPRLRTIEEVAGTPGAPAP